MSTRLAAAIVAVASIAASAAAESREPLDAGPFTTHLVWIDPTGVAIGVEAQARDEAQSLLRRMGVSASWRRGVAGEITCPGEVRVILLDRGAVRAPAAPILGATPLRVDGPRLVWVHMPNVRAAMGLGPRGPATGIDPLPSRPLAIALGRIVAHELVHALAPSVPHGTGLMSATLTRRQLSSAILPLDPEVGLAVQAALRGEPALPPADTATIAAATAGRELER